MQQVKFIFLLGCFTVSTRVSCDVSLVPVLLKLLNTYKELDKQILFVNCNGEEEIAKGLSFIKVPIELIDLNETFDYDKAKLSKSGILAFDSVQSLENFNRKVIKTNWQINL